MLIEWTKEYELGYWCKQDKQADEQKMKNTLREFPSDHYKDRNPNVVIDIGGGRYGGALSVFREGKRRMLFDILADEFVEMGDLPDIEAVDCSFVNIPLADNSVDMVFAWEVFDHANCLEELEAGYSECQRVLAPGGRLLLRSCIRVNPIGGHIVPMTVEKMDKLLTCRCLWKQDHPGGNVGFYDRVLTK